jgi:hypothetical protein
MAFKSVRSQFVPPNLGATMQEQIAVLDIEELAHVGGGWGEVDPTS